MKIMLHTAICLAALAAGAGAGAAMAAGARADGDAAPQRAPAIYSLPDCLRLGMERSTLIANALRDAQIAEARVWQAGAPAWPQVKLKGNYTRVDKKSETTFQDETLEFGSLNRYTAALSGEQLLYSGGKVSAGIAAARLARQYARSGVTAAHAAMTRDITTGFYDVLLAAAAVEVRRASLKHLRAMQDEAELKERNDLMSEFEVLSARVRVANERPLLIAAVNTLSLAKTSFRNLLSLEDEEFDLAGEIAMAQPQFDDLDAALEHGMEYRPEILQARDLVDIRRQDFKAARGAWQPELRAVANYNAANPDDSAGISAEDEWGFHWNAGLTAAWDVFDGGLRRGAIREKRLVMEKQQADLTELLKNIRLQIRQAWLNVQHAAEAVQGGEENVQLAERALSIAQVRFAQGFSTYLELTETNLALSTAQLTRLRALRDHIHAVAHLHHACGLPANPPE